LAQFDTVNRIHCGGLVRHKNYQTRQRYINMLRQADAAVDGLYVPDLTPAKKPAAAQA